LTVTYVDWFLLIAFVPPLAECAGNYWWDTFADLVAAMRAGVQRFRTWREG
jgi:hypothetical protein